MKMAEVFVKTENGWIFVMAESVIWEYVFLQQPITYKMLGLDSAKALEIIQFLIHELNLCTNIG